MRKVSFVFFADILLLFSVLFVLSGCVIGKETFSLSVKPFNGLFPKIISKQYEEGKFVLFLPSDIDRNALYVSYVFFNAIFHHFPPISGSFLC